MQLELNEAIREFSYEFKQQEVDFSTRSPGQKDYFPRTKFQVHLIERVAASCSVTE